MESFRIVLLGKDFELRFVSLVVRSRELSDDVVLFDLGSSDNTKDLAKKIDCRIVDYSDELHVPKLCSSLLNDDPARTTLLVNVTNQFKLRDLPLLVNRARESWDVHMSYTSDNSEVTNPQEVSYSDGEISHLAVSIPGMEALSKSSISDSPVELDSGLKVRVLHTTPPPNVQQRESLATASRFAQLLYWMLESRHPLLLFGIPGFVLFMVGYKLSGDVLDSFNEWNETSVGVGLAVIAVTLMGLFAMMVGLILYILGKQVKQIQSQYQHWPKNNEGL